MRTNQPGTDPCAFPLPSLLDQELALDLGADRSERSETRRGWRNGTLERTLLTEQGGRPLTVPRARLFTEDGTTQEWRSRLVPRSRRRSARVDQALLGA